MRGARRLVVVLGALALSVTNASALEQHGPQAAPETVSNPVVVTVPAPEIRQSSRSEITPRSVVAAINAYRAQYGLSALHEDAQLDGVASDRMKEMEDLGYWNHVSPDGRVPFEWYWLRGYEFGTAGENLARGFESTELLLQGWIESKGHRDNILSTRYRDCGVAVIDGSTTGPATGRSVVLVFGSRLGQ